ncbi:hypothetical protein BTO02_14050 [Paraburkholderia sp. SOS3]|jgi:hypothetical protein|nr:hypothetical protein BTO02_14050 [Paraburkholderia sp. SOS3]
MLHGGRFDLGIRARAPISTFNGHLLECARRQAYIGIPFARELPMRKLMAAIIASLIGLTALSVSTTAVACGDAGYSSDGK